MIASVLVDSSAALAIVARRGNGKLRHVRVGHLWVQERAQAGELLYKKVRGEQNPADLLTKPVPAGKVTQFSTELGQVKLAGGAEVRLSLNGVGELHATAEGSLHISSSCSRRAGSHAITGEDVRAASSSLRSVCLSIELEKMYRFNSAISEFPVLRNR